MTEPRRRRAEPEVPAIIRGSRKHVLDWTEQATFREELIELLSPAVKVRVPNGSVWMPRGYAEKREARLETFGREVIPGSAIWSALQGWWLGGGRGNTPNWDLAAACELEGRPGLVLVEAKANVPELCGDGKAMRAKASEASTKSHECIARAIHEARVELRGLGHSTGISRDNHYQLSNRIAFSWKLASLDIPTVLVYLGFLDDQGVADAGEPFNDDPHWRSVFAEHAREVGAESLFEKGRIECGAAPAWFLVRSRRVLGASPPRPSGRKRVRA